MSLRQVIYNESIGKVKSSQGRCWLIKTSQDTEERTSHSHRSIVIYINHFRWGRILMKVDNPTSIWNKHPVRKKKVNLFWPVWEVFILFKSDVSRGLLGCGNTGTDKISWWRDVGQPRFSRISVMTWSEKNPITLFLPLIPETRKQKPVNCAFQTSLEPIIKIV